MYTSPSRHCGVAVTKVRASSPLRLRSRYLKAIAFNLSWGRKGCQERSRSSSTRRPCGSAGAHRPAGTNIARVTRYVVKRGAVRAVEVALPAVPTLVSSLALDLNRAPAVTTHLAAKPFHAAST